MFGKSCISGIMGRVAVIAVLSMVLACAASALCPVYGQIDNELDGLYESNFGGYGAQTRAGQLVSNIRSALVRFLKLIVGVASLASLVLAAYNMFNGEQSGAKRFFMWGLGLAIGWTLLTVLGNMSTPAGAVEGFAGLQGTVAEVLEIALSMVCMVTLAVVVIHIMNGERDGFQKLFRWMIISGVGVLLVEVMRIKT